MDSKQTVAATAEEISWSEVGFRFPPRSNGNRISRGIGWIDPPPGIVLGLLRSQTVPVVDGSPGRSGRQGDSNGFGYKSGRGYSEVRRRWTN